MPLSELLLSVDVPLISECLLQGELLLPAEEEQLLLQLPGADSCSGEDIELIKLQRGPLPKHELVLLPQERLLPKSVHALWLPREPLQPVGEQLLLLQGRELPLKGPR